MSDLVHHFFSVKGGATTTPATTSTNAPSVHVAVQGCCHGALDGIYAACASHEKATGRKIDFLVCCGDFQAIRDESGLRSMAVLPKYRVLGDFAAYYRGEKQAPYLTLFVGGNHEDSDWLAAECYGGFLAPNIYYLGHSGAVVVDECVTVAGLSGIFKGHDYLQPYPRRPFHASEAGKRSAYHVRRIEVEKLKAFSKALACVQQQQQRPTCPAKALTAESGAPASRCAAAFSRVDLFVSHDWPAGITKYGDEEQLLRFKPYFADDIRHGALGNPHTMPLLRVARPRYWLAAHLHCKFGATVPHHDVDDDAAAAGALRSTEFIALDKCARGKGFLDFIDIPANSGCPTAGINRVRSAGGQGRVVHHPLWLEVLRETHGGLTANDGKWSAESCALLRRAPEQLRGLATWVPASSTMSVLETLALPPAPLQVPPALEERRHRPAATRGDVAAAETATTSTAAVLNAEDGVIDDLDFVEDTTGAV